MRIRERYELAAESVPRYRRPGRKERGQILDAFCLATGYHRRYAMPLLRGAASCGRGKGPYGSGDTD